MPELPEVEVVRAGLEPAVSGARVLHVDVVDDRALTRHDGPAEDFAERLTGRTIAAAVRRGKFMWFPLVPGHDGDRPEALVTHLGMSGQVLLGRGRPAAKHRRILIDVQPTGTDRDGRPEAPVELEFVDQRTFGSMAIDAMVPTVDGAPAGSAGAVDARDPDAPWRRSIPTQVSHIARDPLDPAFDDDRFVAMARKRSSGIKRVLLDQGVVSGIGNIYADESLWAAKLYFDRPRTGCPGRPAPAPGRGPERPRPCARGRRHELRRAVRQRERAVRVLLAAPRGVRAAGKPCPRCGTTIVREAFMNRSSHRCPVCQPAPRRRTR